MSKLQQDALCLCGSGASYATCCEPYHKGAKSPENALKLMRSRYVAYALHLPDYIIATTHPASPKYQPNLFAWKRGIAKFSKNNSFDRLEIVEFKEHGDFATVTFIAHLTEDESDQTFCERSYFEKYKGRWLYHHGDLVEGHEPNFETAEQLQSLPLAYYGDPILTKKAEPVAHITEDLRHLVGQMIHTMDACHGIGLAAPQVHYSIRLFVMHQPIVTKEGLDLGEVQVFINPEVSAPSLETWKAEEGCLSIPTVRGEVERPQVITVEYTNLEGQRIKAEFQGWEARVILHEYDHLNGVLFLEHLDQKERQVLEPFLQQLKQRLHNGTEL